MAKVQLSEYVDAYAKALHVNADAVKVGVRELKDKNQDYFAVLVTSDDVPLMITSLENGSYQWSECTLRNLSDKSGVLVGTSTDGADLAYMTDAYKEVVAQHFSQIRPPGTFNMKYLTQVGAKWW